MRLLVLADSHRRRSLLWAAIQAQPQARALLFLGDGEDDLEDVRHYQPELPLFSAVFKVRGNNDWASQAPLTRLETFRDTRIFLTHGHTLRVKYGEDALLHAAAQQDAAIAIYGHTHRPVHVFRDKTHLFNPGSIAEGDYGVIDLTKAGIACLPMQV